MSIGTVLYFANKDEKGSTYSLAAIWSEKVHQAAIEKLWVSAFPVIVLQWIIFSADEIIKSMLQLISLNDTGNVKMMKNMLNF